MKVSRRQALAMGGMGALGVVGIARPFGPGAHVEAKAASRLASRNMPVPYAAKFVRPRVLPFADMEDSDGRYRLYTVTEQAGIANIVPGLKTPVFGYDGIAPGPTIRVPQGRRVKLRVRNQLPAINPISGRAFNTSTHLHGSASLPQYDGYADD